MVAAPQGHDPWTRSSYDGRKLEEDNGIEPSPIAEWNAFPRRLDTMSSIFHVYL